MKYINLLIALKKKKKEEENRDVLPNDEKLIPIEGNSPHMIENTRILPAYKLHKNSFKVRSNQVQSLQRAA